MFKTIDANIYRPIVAAPGFLDGQPFAYNASEASVIAFNYYASLSRETLEAMHAWFVENRDTDRVQRLPNKECISIYGSNFVTGYSGRSLVHPHAMLLSR